MLSQPYRPVSYRTEHRYTHPGEAASQPHANAKSSVKDHKPALGNDYMSTRQQLQQKVGLVGTFHMIPGHGVNNQVYRGRLEATGEDHFVVRHMNSGQREVLPLSALDSAVFTESTSAYTSISGQAAPSRYSLSGQ
ncbi:spore coat protein GerQ [Paenibacillus kandeliae]|uniref:spore coat protein GerQ n=1 Tax=Paenibacillus kandeliae TaxID=3231269 RepID=UPI003458A0E3